MTIAGMHTFISVPTWRDISAVEAAILFRFLSKVPHHGYQNHSMSPLIKYIVRNILVNIEGRKSFAKTFIWDVIWFGCKSGPFLKNK